MDKNVHPIIAKQVKEKYLDEVTERKKKGESVYDLSLSGKITSALWNLASPSDEAEAKQKIHKGYDDEDAVQGARDARDDEVWRKEQQGQDTDKKGYRGAIVVLLLFLVCVGAIAVRHFEALSVKGRFGAIIAVIFLVYVVFIAIKDNKN